MWAIVRRSVKIIVISTSAAKGGGRNAFGDGTRGYDIWAPFQAAGIFSKCPGSNSSAILVFVSPTLSDYTVLKF